jgi:hypothetical protein
MEISRLKKIAGMLGLCAYLLQPVAAWSFAQEETWRNLSPREREEVLKNYKRWKNLPPQDKEHLREQWDRWQNLPQDRRNELRDRYERMQRRKNQR